MSNGATLCECALYDVVHCLIWCPVWVKYIRPENKWLWTQADPNHLQLLSKCSLKSSWSEAAMKLVRLGLRERKTWLLFISCHQLCGEEPCLRRSTASATLTPGYATTSEGSTRNWQKVEKKNFKFHQIQKRQFLILPSIILHIFAITTNNHSSSEPRIGKKKPYCSIGERVPN